MTQLGAKTERDLRPDSLIPLDAKGSNLPPSKSSATLVHAIKTNIYQPSYESSDGLSNDDEKSEDSVDVVRIQEEMKK